LAGGERLEAMGERPERKGWELRVERTNRKAES
jgi:hypothetical protein